MADGRYLTYGIAFRFPKLLACLAEILIDFPQVVAIMSSMRKYNYMNVLYSSEYVLILSRNR